MLTQRSNDKIRSLCSSNRQKLLHIKKLEAMGIKPPIEAPCELIQADMVG
jgi:hypothetical protein